MKCKQMEIKFLKVKYLNNIREQGHYFIKEKIKTILGFWSLKSARNTIFGIETMYMIKKGQIDLKTKNVLFEIQFINEILGVIV